MLCVLRSPVTTITTQALDTVLKLGGDASLPNRHFDVFKRSDEARHTALCPALSAAALPCPGAGTEARRQRIVCSGH